MAYVECRQFNDTTCTEHFTKLDANANLDKTCCWLSQVVDEPEEPTAEQLAKKTELEAAGFLLDEGRWKRYCVLDWTTIYPTGEQIPDDHQWIDASGYTIKGFCNGAIQKVAGLAASSAVLFMSSY